MKATNQEHTQNGRSEAQLWRLGTSSYHKDPPSAGQGLNRDELTSCLRKSVSGGF